MNPDNPNFRSSVTVEQLDQQIVAYQDLLDKKAEAEVVVSEFGRQIARQEAKLVEYLKDLGRKDYHHPKLTIKISQKWRVNLPQTDLDKLKFFDWLRSKGLFERYATVNSASLNSLFLAEWEAMKSSSPEDAVGFTLPGVPPPTLFEALSKRKGKDS